MAVTPVRSANGAHFLVALLATFIVVCGAVFARAAIIGADISEARQRVPVVVRVQQPADMSGVAKAAEILGRTDGVAAALPVSPERAALLLQQAGVNLTPDRLPTLLMIEAQVEGRLGDPKTRLRELLAREGVLAEIDAAPLADAQPIREAAWGAGLITALLGLSLIWLSARAQALVAGAAAVINADIGAPLSRTLSSYGRSGALFGFRAGLIGSAIAVAATIGAIIAPRVGPTLADVWALTGRLELAMVFIAPLLIALAACSGARAGGAEAHRKAERIG